MPQLLAAAGAGGAAAGAAGTAGAASLTAGTGAAGLGGLGASLAGKGLAGALGGTSSLTSASGVQGLIGKFGSALSSAGKGSALGKIAGNVFGEKAGKFADALSGVQKLSSELQPKLPFGSLNLVGGGGGGGGIPTLPDLGAISKLFGATTEEEEETPGTSIDPILKPGFSRLQR